MVSHPIGPDNLHKAGPLNQACQTESEKTLKTSSIRALRSLKEIHQEGEDERYHIDSH